MANLDEVKKGDRLILEKSVGNRIRHDRVVRAVVVQSVTPKGIRVGDIWYSKTGGAIRGWDRSSSIRLAQPGELEELDRLAAENTQRIKAEREAREAHEATEEHRIASALSYWEHEQWEKLPIESLRQIAALARIEP